MGDREPAGDGIPLVVCARYDAPRRGLVLNDRGGRSRGGPVSAWLAGCAVIVTATALAREQGVDAGGSASCS